MCGIIGYVGSETAQPILLEGLKCLEYRGYDSSGIATLDGSAFHLHRAQGKLESLIEKAQQMPLPGRCGIGHTRWATHGEPSETNAHPHLTKSVALVHNGIIENYQNLKAQLQSASLSSDTDTEIIAHVLEDALQRNASPFEAMQTVLKQLIGTYSLAVLFREHAGSIAVARSGSPLAVGQAEDGVYVASDAIALSQYTQQICFLEDGDWALLDAQGYRLFDRDNQPIERPCKTIEKFTPLAGKGNYRHYMLKEIHEQPDILAQSVRQNWNEEQRLILLKPEALPVLETFSRLVLTACGTSYYAGLVGRYWFENLAGLSADIDIASELRYRDYHWENNGALLVLSQSGETMDSLEAVKRAQAHQQKIIAIVNVPDASIARAADLVLPTLAGPEIGVASTKAFTSQLLTLLMLALALGKTRGKLSDERLQHYSGVLRHLPGLVSQCLNREEQIMAFAEPFAALRNVLYLGRGALYPIALEGALKIKETSYINAEGFAAGEMKHGPIALVDEHVCTVCVAPSGPLFEKIFSNAREILARKGRILVLSDAEGIARFTQESGQSGTIWHLEMPACDPVLAPILYAVPVQLLAYYVALAKGTDIDQPRNLAKSVTVE